MPSSDVNIDRLVKTWVATERDEEIQETVNEISAGKATLLTVVKALGDYLTSDNDELRTKGLDFLSRVIAACPPDQINAQGVRVLTTFLCGKLEDTETISPALKGLKCLTARDNFGEAETPEVVRSIFFHVKMRALTAAVRYLVFGIFDDLMTRNRSALKSLGSEFVSGYASMIEGEKDPRNLLISFAIIKVILVEFDIAAHIEALYNITFCYFPISFRPPENDPYGITPDNLRTSLRSCLAGTPLFGPLAVPLFSEKLMAGSSASKQDTLQTIAFCLPVYGPYLAQEKASELWSTIKIEIFQPIDSETEGEALETTQVLVRTIHSDQEVVAANNVDKFAQSVVQECLAILKEPEKSKARPAVKVLCSLIASCPSVAEYTVKESVPFLLKLFHDPDEMSTRPPITLLLAEIIVVCRDASSMETEILLAAYKDDILGVLTVALKSSASARPAIAGLKAAVETDGLLTLEEVGFVVHNANEVLLLDASDDVNADILRLLNVVATITIKPVEEQTLPLLFGILPDEANTIPSPEDRAKWWRTLAGLSAICSSASLFETLSVRLLTKLDLVCSRSANLEDSEPAAAYAHALLSTLADTLQLKVERGDTDVQKYADRLIPRLYNLFVSGAYSGDAVTQNSRVLAVAGQLITIVIRALPQIRQDQFAKTLCAAFDSGDVLSLADGHRKIPSTPKFEPFAEHTSESHANMVVLFTAGILPLRKEVKLPLSDLNSFVSNVGYWVLSPNRTAWQRESAWLLLSIVVNKHVEDLQVYLSSLADYWTSEISDSAKSPERRRNAIRTWSWVSKALVLRNHPHGIETASRLLELFQNTEVGWDAAAAVGEVIGSDVAVTKLNFAVIRILHAQKYFNALSPKIISGIKSSSNVHERTAFLIALAALVKSAPSAVYVGDMEKLMPLLLQALSVVDSRLRSSVIDTIAGVAQDQPASITQHASTLVTTMLSNAIPPAPATVRLAALRFLALIPDAVRYDHLHPYKASVLKQLNDTLDDPKKVVRKAAVETRSKWYKYSG